MRQLKECKVFIIVVDVIVSSFNVSETVQDRTKKGLAARRIFLQSPLFSVFSPSCCIVVFNPVHSLMSAVVPDFSRLLCILEPLIHTATVISLWLPGLCFASG